MIRHRMLLAVAGLVAALTLAGRGADPAAETTTTSTAGLAVRRRRRPCSGSSSRSSSRSAPRWS